LGGNNGSEVMIGESEDSKEIVKAKDEIVGEEATGEANGWDDDELALDDLSDN
jgi:phosphopantothenoylcysteine synthetase/decarboxylase